MVKSLTMVNNVRHQKCMRALMKNMMSPNSGLKMVEIYNIAARPYYCCHTTPKQSHCTPHLRIYCLKEGASLPAMFNPLFSSTNQQLF